MQVLVFGKTGQVARELQRYAGVTTLSRGDADLSDPAACAEMIAQTNADAVINAAAYTAVDQAETDTKQAFRVNSEAPSAMANAAAKRALPFLHISSDYVFDGSGTTPWVEDAPTGPLGVYGASKLAGEQGVRDANGPHAILRTSWVVSAHGANFVKTMLRLGAERDALSIVADQIGAPTPARDIAEALMQMAAQLCADPSKSGTYHFAGMPDASWADFAREIFAQSGTVCDVTDIPSSDYPTPAARPKNSRLDCTKVNTIFSISRPDWRVGLAGILSELKAET
ncbi:MAG: dTDP-4-dehydrorhamnose reductase [Thalassovita sp.]